MEEEEEGGWAGGAEGAAEGAADGAAKAEAEVAAAGVASAGGAAGWREEDAFDERSCFCCCFRSSLSRSRLRCWSSLTVWMLLLSARSSAVESLPRSRRCCEMRKLARLDALRCRARGGEGRREKEDEEDMREEGMRKGT